MLKVQLKKNLSESKNKFLGCVSVELFDKMKEI